MISTKYRSNSKEIMDDFDMTGDVLIKTLDQIAKINVLLGGNSLTLNGVKQLLKNQPKDQPITIVDLGCGNGDLLRIIAKYGRKKGYTFQLLGIDANKFTLEYAMQLSKKYPEITYLEQDVLSEEFKEQSYDIALSTLFLHHFTNEEIENILEVLQNQAKIGVVINDLHRHKLAYYLFKIITLFIKNKMVKNDGLISILKGFKKQELKNFAKQLKGKSSIVWRWAFRYQWIIKYN
ncbi:methyltransferase domain-containing protein [Tenacibaculum sp. MEBiC06402]|uniref:methyltransferase domain-containing protein n=1 Tax=unclassified Tenacibaculum TaxID=2635139 RepID=UPI003B9D0175